MSTKSSLWVVWCVMVLAYLIAFLPLLEIVNFKGWVWPYWSALFGVGVACHLVLIRSRKDVRLRKTVTIGRHLHRARKTGAITVLICALSFLLGYAILLLLLAAAVYFPFAVVVQGVQLWQMPRIG